MQVVVSLNQARCNIDSFTLHTCVLNPRKDWIGIGVECVESVEEEVVGEMIVDSVVVVARESTRR